ncbi:MAG: NYN domain-containing protein [Candidatus Babeliales bacterium]
MNIILDGYNILKAFSGTHVPAQERDSYIRRLERYSKTRHHQIVIVFDGGPYTWPHAEHVAQGVRVIYSGSKSSADAVIMQYLDDHHTQDLLLVTNDRAIITHGARVGVLAISGTVFNAYLSQALKPTAPLEKSSQALVQKLIIEEDAQYGNIDALMQGAHMHSGKDENSDISSGKARQRSVSTISKKERALQAKLNKL